ncbi:hypothetical protein AAG747_24545 [Rapidithrix thailandica]|uniref:Uncharacterized protein n=1 Tax=Rapidithrix thailandica TaxID=413964 RepID=A0AAW9S1Q7_9BACT
MNKRHGLTAFSSGEERLFRMKHWKEKGFKDLPMTAHGVIVIPWETNLHWTHEVPYFKKYQGKRISITLREFQKDGKCPR